MQTTRRNWLDRTAREALTAESNGRSVSRAEARRIAASFDDGGHRERTRQPKRGEPGYVYRGVPQREDGRIALADEWGREMASRYPAERAGAMRAAERADRRKKVG